MSDSLTLPSSESYSRGRRRRTYQRDTISESEKSQRRFVSAPALPSRAVINAVHTIVYSDDAEATRAFFRDVLGWPYIDAHDGWLIFKSGPSELGVHPTQGEAFSTERHHEIWLMCDDIDETRNELEAKGVMFTGATEQQAWGRFATFAVPGAGTMSIYQPRHAKAYEL
jgi:predicted enzyme related to lactoylglutathione lyase